ncbi:MAG: hypothetical protein ACP5OA_04240 [Candidatus Woesearchaeota archaeon]
MISQNIQRRDKPLEQIIIRSLKTLKKREITVSPETIKKIWRHADKYPDKIRDYLQQGIKLSLENRVEKSQISDYMRTAVNIVGQKPELLDEFYEKGLNVIDISKGKIGNFFPNALKVFLRMPENIETYLKYGLEVWDIEKLEPQHLAENFFEHATTLTIKKPFELERYVYYAKKIKESGYDYPTKVFLECAPKILIKFPEFFNEYAETSIKLIEAEKNREKGWDHRAKDWYIGATELGPGKGNNIDSYLGFARHIMESRPELFSIYGKEGLKFIENKNLEIGVAGSFFRKGFDLILKNPEKLSEYIDRGIKLGRERYKNERYPVEVYFRQAPDLLIKKPEEFQKYIEDSLKIFEYSKNKREVMGLAASYLMTASKILTELPDIYQSYLKYAKKIIKINPELGKRFLDIKPRRIFKDPEIFEKMAKMGLTMSKKSTDAAKKFFWYCDMHELNITVNNIITFNDMMSEKRTYLTKNLYDIILRTEDIYEEDIIEKRAYNTTISLIKSMGRKKLDRDEALALDSFSEEFIKKIKDETHTSLYDKKTYPKISALLKNEINFPEKEDINSYRFGKWSIENSDKKIKSLKFGKELLIELKHYFETTKNFSEDLMEEIRLLQEMYDANIYANRLRFASNGNILDDFFSEREDCLSYKGKYSEASKNLLLNKYSLIHNISTICAYSKPREYEDNTSRKDLGRIISCVAKIEDKKVLYVAGISSNPELGCILEWKKGAYDAIIETARLNRRKIDGVFFDLNPRNRDKLSHNWAEYVAKRAGLKKGVDYIYQNKNLSTKDFITHRRGTIFELINPEWKEILILRSEGLEGKFFLEGVMQEPKNKEIGPGIDPDLVYNKGYVIGKYVSIK